MFYAEVILCKGEYVMKKMYENIIERLNCKKAELLMRVQIDKGALK